MKDYDKFMQEFLKSIGVSVSIEYIGLEKLFNDDEFKCDVYKVTLSRGDRSYSYRYGASLVNTLNEPPSEYDVISSLTLQGFDTFEDFCNECGRDTDFRKTYKIYSEIQAEFMGVSRIFSDDEIETILNNT